MKYHINATLLNTDGPISRPFFSTQVRRSLVKHEVPIDFTLKYIVNIQQTFTPQYKHRHTGELMAIGGYNRTQYT